MDKDLAIFFAIVLFFISLLFYSANYLAGISCITKWQMSGFNSKYEFKTGCLVEVSKNKWIPEKNYREFAE